MKKFTKILAILFLFILCLGAYGCWHYFVPYKWNYRITITIQTPEGIRTGTAVRQVQAKLNVPIGDSGPIIYRTIGEAVVIDLGEKGVLFDLNNWDSNSTVASAFPNPKKTAKETVAFYVNLNPEMRVEQTGWVSFVWLKSFDENSALKRLDSRDFKAELGDGYQLKSRVIEITNDPVTWEIKSLLEKMNGKFGNYYGRHSFKYEG